MCKSAKLQLKKTLKINQWTQQWMWDWLIGSIAITRIVGYKGSPVAIQSQPQMLQLQFQDQSCEDCSYSLLFRASFPTWQRLAPVQLKVTSKSLIRTTAQTVLLYIYITIKAVFPTEYFPSKLIRSYVLNQDLKSDIHKVLEHFQWSDSCISSYSQVIFATLALKASKIIEENFNDELYASSIANESLHLLIVELSG